MFKKSHLIVNSPVTTRAYRQPGLYINESPPIRNTTMREKSNGVNNS